MPPPLAVSDICSVARGNATGRSALLTFFRSSAFSMGLVMLATTRFATIPPSIFARELFCEPRLSVTLGIALEWEVLGGLAGRWLLRGVSGRGSHTAVFAAIEWPLDTAGRTSLSVGGLWRRWLSNC